ncbi:alpha-L-fucosidase [Asticcacaulis sp. BYS171W]|uniref:alpha-L-fucosidase n=1 Tax=Asticcacaulis aquaticus TaxID=2984212 RepID=A0ABT5HWE9_9CAUL|nr:alpha-L-fucosidase [Asticcacaulis aquaticus]MDC7684170.1 alpha-L-fucosidase [Asticcacaulis aquaticus]
MHVLKTLLLTGTLFAATAHAQPHPIADAQGRTADGQYPMDYKAGPVEAQLKKVDQRLKRGAYKPDWAALKAYETPDWFRDAKFGIFIHWGPYSVPAFANEWYTRNMYAQGNSAFRHHVETWGPQNQFGYKDFIPMFTAEKFDANAWIDLFQRAGARYVIPVAEHCDGFAMYDSAMTEWKATTMGPKRDTTGELATAARAKGMHFGLSSHRAEHWWWFNDGRKYDSDVNDPKYAGLYGPAAPMRLNGDDAKGWPDGNHLENWFPPNKEFLDDWLARTTELVDKYRPEMVYLDWWSAAPAFEPNMRKFAAYYYSDGRAKGYAPTIAYKGEQFIEGSALFDIERGKLDALRLEPWQTDTSVSIKSWGYVDGDSYRTAKSLIGDLIDVVAKNGNLLLNVGPKADGTLPEEAKTVLLGMGVWLTVNGEAIYGSRPWTYFGEGPTVTVTGEKKETPNKVWTAQDIRFTTNKGKLYAMGFVRPADGKVFIRTLYKDTPYLNRAPTSIELVETGKAVAWRQTDKGLEIDLPPLDSDMPYVLRLSL